MADLLNFLQTIVDKNRAYSTVRSYAAGLRDFYFFTKLQSEFQSVVYNKFLQGSEALAPLPRATPTVWDVSIPLNFLRSRPVPVTFVELASESALLLLLATGLRVSDLTCISANCSQSSVGMTFSFCDHRKVRIHNSSMSSFHVPLFIEERICPIRALIRYRESAAEFRMDSDYLFISSTGWRAATKTLQGWVTSVLKDAGIIATAGSTRAASTSFAFSTGVPLEKILRSAGWASAGTFFRHYRRDIDPTGQILFENKQN
jgi:site-specific recombinase XerD